jgi:hypothetical protein
MTNDQIEAVLDDVRTWPREDLEELAEIAREIAARRAGVFRASADELKAINDADVSDVATSAEVEAAFGTFRRA